MLTLANSGIPMIGIVIPYWIAFIPVALIEGLIAKRMLRIRLTYALNGTFIANAVSTIIGLSLTWVFMVFVQLTLGSGSGRTPSNVWEALISSAWLGPSPHGVGDRITVAALALTLPFFLASFAIEYAVVRWYWYDRPRAAGRRTCLIANATTYALWVLFWASLMLFRSR